MTELQKQNFEHTQRELTVADAVVRTLTTLRDDNQKSVEYATNKLAETKTILAEAKQKAGIARERFEAVIEEIAPEPVADKDGGYFTFLAGSDPLSRFASGGRFGI